MARKLYKLGVVIFGWFVTNLLGVAAIGALGLVVPVLKFIPGRCGEKLFFNVFIVSHLVAGNKINAALVKSPGILSVPVKISIGFCLAHAHGIKVFE